MNPNIEQQLLEGVGSIMLSDCMYIERCDGIEKCRSKLRPLENEN
jgi:hypothetical protein